MNKLVRSLITVTLVVAASFAAPAFALDAGDIVVASIKGEVHVTMNGAEKPMRAGAVLVPPASVRTGRDGAIELRQGATSVNVGPDTQLEFPALEKAGGPIDRIVQPRGNAFYDIGKREGRRLRVETPYLVGVIKGTQFNVAAQENATTISLFEGRLEVHATDESAVVDLLAGEIASRKRGDKSITVIKMEPGKAPPTQRPTQSSGNGAGSTSGNGGSSGGTRAGTTDAGRLVNSPRTGADETVTTTLRQVSGVVDTLSDTRVAAGVDVRANGIDANVNANVGAADVNAGVSVGVANGAATVDVAAGVSVGAGPASVDAGVNAGVSLSNGVAVDAAANIAVGVGNVAAVDTNIGAAVDVGANGVSAGVDLGATAGVGNVATVDTGVNTAVGVGANGISAGVDLGAAAGVGNVATVDTGVSTTVDLGAAAPTVTTNVDVGTSVAGVDAGVSAGVNVGAGTVDLGLNVAGVNLGLGIDLGLDGHGTDTVDTSGQNTSNSTPPPATPPPGNIVDDVGGLLDGLLRRPGRK